MAERAVQLIQDDGASRTYQWTGLLNGDAGEWVEAPEFGDRCVQISGTAGAGLSVSLQGTNSTSLNAVILSDPNGNPITKSAVDVLETALDVPRHTRPNVTAGDGTTNLTVTLYCRRTQR